MLADHAIALYSLLQTYSLRTKLPAMIQLTLYHVELGRRLVVFESVCLQLIAVIDDW